MNAVVTTDAESATDEFRADVLRGLMAHQKAICSRYFYDAEGDRLFQCIMACADYYLTRAEDQILSQQTDAVLAALAGDSKRFSLFELGAGDGTKTTHLLGRALQQGRDPVYRPIDISANALRQLGEKLRKQLPALRYRAEQGEYFEAIDRMSCEPNEPKAVLFLGSNIGNLDHERAISLMKGVAAHLGTEDRLLVGFDRRKDPATILRAYDDRDGYTAAFNLNLLHRINRELCADFVTEHFIHLPVYDPTAGRALSYLVSTIDQDVHFAGLDQAVHFRAWEAMQTEISQKYDRPMIEDLAQHAGLRITAEFTDSREYFTDVVFAPDSRLRQHRARGRTGRDALGTIL